MKAKFINENMGYTDFFGKKVSHEDSLKKRIRDLITHIVVSDRGISEKSFSEYDNVIKEVEDLCNSNPEIYEWVQDYYDSGSRLELLSEEVYDKFFKKEGN